MDLKVTLRVTTNMHLDVGRRTNIAIWTYVAGQMRQLGPSGLSVLCQLISSMLGAQWLLEGCFAEGTFLGTAPRLLLSKQGCDLGIRVFFRLAPQTQTASGRPCCESH